MTCADRCFKRSFDLAVSIPALLLLWPLIGVTWFMAYRDTGASGLFTQTRIGKDGKPFTVMKLRTMRINEGSTVTTHGDARITPFGAKLRKYKLDELPQLWNIIKGEMSLVGPRPDVAGYMDRLKCEDREILALRPGITGPATLKYRDEEVLLAQVKNPQRYNDEVIWPDKVRINRDYLHNYSLFRDIRYLLATVHLASHGVE